MIKLNMIIVSNLCTWILNILPLIELIEKICFNKNKNIEVKNETWLRFLIS